MGQTSKITKISDYMCSVESFVTWVAFAIMLALLLIQVICRYCFNLPLAWAEEMVRYVYIGVSFTGAIVAVREGSHIGIDILPVILKKFCKTEVKLNAVLDVFDIVAYIISAIIMAILTLWMFNYTMSLQDSNQLTTCNQWPVWLMCLPVVISLALMCVHYVLLIFERIIEINTLKKEVKA